jgi:predicted unusual protein kinase regulating ubiquinone biosynthesis (AarF/ABC1/UbiB family)
VDLLPTEYIEELALLQDEVPGVSFDEIQHEVEVNLGGSLMTLLPSLRGSL